MAAKFITIYLRNLNYYVYHFVENSKFDANNLYVYNCLKLDNGITT